MQKGVRIVGPDGVPKAGWGQMGVRGVEIGIGVFTKKKIFFQEKKNKSRTHF